MKHLLIKMASIANELDFNGYEKEANEITQALLKLAQLTPANLGQRQNSKYTKEQEETFKRILKNPKFQGLSEDVLYLIAKGVFATDQNTANFANNFIAFKRSADGTYTGPKYNPNQEQMAKQQIDRVQREKKQIDRVQREKNRGFGSQNEGFMPAGGGKFKD
jgi:hypothetical protein